MPLPSKTEGMKNSLRYPSKVISRLGEISRKELRDLTILRFLSISMLLLKNDVLLKNDDILSLSFDITNQNLSKKELFSTKKIKRKLLIVTTQQKHNEFGTTSTA